MGGGTVGLVALVAVGLLGVERLVELAINRANVAWLKAHGARFARSDGFALILAVQVLLVALVPLEAWAAPWARLGWWTLPALALLVVAQAVRYWVIATLGKRWCIRVATLPGAPRILGGPYRFMRHPNYAVVLAESVLLPLAFGAWATLALVVPLNMLALARRIRREDRALAEAAGPEGAGA